LYWSLKWWEMHKQATNWQFVSKHMSLQGDNAI